jgi:hypothetical protein
MNPSPVESSWTYGGLDLAEVLRRVAKYFVEGGAVALAAYYLPKGRSKLSGEEILVIAFTAATTFAILDMYSPSISGAARAGAGFGIGANLVGFPASGATKFSGRMM